MNKQLLSFHGDPKIKAFYLERVRAHKAADEIIQGKYWENGKGCAVGCTIHSSDHSKYPEILGIPEWLAHLKDKIFEGLSNKKAKDFPEQFLSAITEGVNLEPVKYRFCEYICAENVERVEKLDISDDLKNQVVTAIKQVKKLHTDAAKTGKWDFNAAFSVASAAWSAALSAAASAAASVESAAWSAAASAESAARSAALSAAASAESAALSAESAALSAENAAYERYAEVLIKLFKEAK